MNKYLNRYLKKASNHQKVPFPKDSPPQTEDSILKNCLSMIQRSDNLCGGGTRLPPSSTE